MSSPNIINGEPAQLSAWMQKTQAQAEARAGVSAPCPFILPSVLNAQNNKTTLLQLCRAVSDTGFAVYEWSDTPADIPDAVLRLLQALSLREGDSGVIRELGELSLLQDLSGTPKGRFPPYQSKAMNWHTDGYYNAANDTIRCFTLHCVEPAAEGGALLLMDDAHLVLALLRDDPQLVALLSHPEAMTLPQNADSDGHDRPARTTPLIQQHADGSLSMRFTTRSKNISWRCAATQAAAQRATELIDAHQQWQTRLTLKKGQGIITRNILHAREPFKDAPIDSPIAGNAHAKRQMLRGRFTNLPTPTAPTNTAHTSAENTHVAR